MTGSHWIEFEAELGNASATKYVFFRFINQYLFTNEYNAFSHFTLFLCDTSCALAPPSSRGFPAYAFSTLCHSTFQSDTNICGAPVDFYVRWDLNPVELRMLCGFPEPRIVRFNYATVKSSPGSPSVFIRDDNNIAQNPKVLAGRLTDLKGMFWDNSTGFEYVVTRCVNSSQTLVPSLSDVS